MVKAWSKNNRREMKRTLGRYLAIAAIVALGVGFFVGLKVCRPAMVQIGSEFVEQSNFYDYQLLSTLGLTEEDRVHFASMEGVTAAEGSVSADLLTVIDGNQLVYKAHQLLDTMNQVQLTAGRMPQAPNECLADDLFMTEESLGMVLPVVNEEDHLFSQEAYTVVGLCNTAQYLNIQRGTTPLGDGTVEGFLFLPAEGFDSEVYTEIYLQLENEHAAFTEEYDAAMEAWETPLEQAVELRGEERKDEIVSEAQAELDDARAEYEDGLAEYREARAEYETEIADAEAEIIDAEARLADGRQELADGEETLKQLEEDPYSVQEIQDARKELDDAWEELRRGEAEYSANLQKFRQEEPEIREQLAAARYQLSLAKQELDSNWYKVQNVDPAFIEMFMPGALQKLEAAEAEYDAAYAEYLAGEQALEDGKAQLADAERQLANARAELQKAEDSFDEEIEKAIEEARKALEDGKKELADAEEKLAEGKAELADARAEADAEFADAEAELADAEIKLNDAQEQIDQLKTPSYYALSRKANSGYASFDNDTRIVDGIARIFPIFFFLVAALVCSSTMTRMVEEQRTQNGTLKALGYSDGQIMWRYASYAGSAALIGGVIGYLLCSWLFPLVIWHAYKMLYHFGEIRLLLDWKLGLISMLFALACSVGAACASAWTEMRQMPAQLMRPKAPKAGKRIFLEYIKPLWKRLGFLHKVAARNIFRYKKRMFMMILGVGGCMSLLIAGLGMRDSISTVAEDQFNRIMLYDYSLVFTAEPTQQEQSEFRQETADLLEECIFVSTMAVDAVTDNGMKNVSIITTDDPAITRVVDLHTGDTPLGYPDDNGVFISSRLAEMAELQVGDMILVQLETKEMIELPITGIFDNYVNHFIYMTGGAYESFFSEPPEYSSALASVGDWDVYEAAARLQNMDNVVSVTVNQDFRSMVEDTLVSLDAIIVLVVGCAIALSFVVSYNLCNINITERQREIATIKVLGFYPNETKAYVFRESIVLTLMGCVVGIPLGIWLHGFVLGQIKVDMVAFHSHINWYSYVLAVVITCAIIGLVDLMLRGKIDRIHMAESLKSVE